MKPTPTPDVINLVVAAREFWDANNDLSDESRALDKALEPFSGIVPYENEPDDAALSVPAAAVVGEPIGYIGQSSADMLRSGETSGAALSREPTKSSTVPVFTECMKQVEAETWEALCKLTFAVQHNPNCPSPWLVRLAGKGPIDMKPYGDGIGLRKHETGDILGFGKTLNEAARAALGGASHE